MTVRSVTFTIPGRLGGKQRAGRKITFRHNAKPVVQTFNPDKTAMQEGIVAQLGALAMRQQKTKQMTGAVSLIVYISRHPPKSWSEKKKAKARWITGKPDADNTIKLLCDGINHSGIWQDDAQVAQLLLERRYDNANPECIRVVISDLEDAA